MGGNRNSGRPRKPTAKLKLHGNYREDRHGGRVDDTALAAIVQKPEMAAIASAKWDELEPKLSAAGYLKDLDADCLRRYCEWWAVWLVVVKVVNGPGLLDRQDVLIANCASKNLTELGARLGLSPTDRAKLSADTKPIETDFETDISKHA